MGSTLLEGAQGGGGLPGSYYSRKLEFYPRNRQALKRLSPSGRGWSAPNEAVFLVSSAHGPASPPGTSAWARRGPAGERVTARCRACPIVRAEEHAPHPWRGTASGPRPRAPAESTPGRGRCPWRAV